MINNIINDLTELRRDIDPALELISDAIRKTDDITIKANLCELLEGLECLKYYAIKDISSRYEIRIDKEVNVQKIEKIIIYDNDGIYIDSLIYNNTIKKYVQVLFYDEAKFDINITLQLEKFENKLDTMITYLKVRKNYKGISLKNIETGGLNYATES